MELWNGSDPLDFTQLLSNVIFDYGINLSPELVSGCTWGDEAPFRENGVTAAVQIQDYHGDRNPYNHTIEDTYNNINQDYLYEQVKANIVFAGLLTEPIAFNHKIRLPLIWGYKY